LQFAICITSKGYDDLENRKIYRIVPDETALHAGCLRVIDESGEDYIYPSDKFLIVEFSEEIQEKLLKSITAEAA